MCVYLSGFLHRQHAVQFHWDSDRDDLFASICFGHTIYFSSNLFFVIAALLVEIVYWIVMWFECCFSVRPLPILRFCYCFHQPIYTDPGKIKFICLCLLLILTNGQSRCDAFNVCRKSWSRSKPTLHALHNFDSHALNRQIIPSWFLILV